jgi:hypothetical protein
LILVLTSCSGSRSWGRAAENTITEVIITKDQ